MLGLVPLLLDAICIVHILRTGRDRMWIYAVTLIPLAGAAAYITCEMLPEFLRGYRGRRMAAGALKTIAPERQIRRRQIDLEITDSVQNRLRLAEEQMALGRYAEATKLYSQAATGLYADDPALLMGLARAHYRLEHHDEALAALNRLRTAHPGYQSHEAHAIYAGSLAATGRDGEAMEEYAVLVLSAPGEEARFRYAQLLERNGREAEAQDLYQEIVDRTRHAPRHYRRTQAEWIGLARRKVES